jgi:hypothetical protein
MVNMYIGKTGVAIEEPPINVSFLTRIIFVEQSSTKECYHQPPPHPNLEMIASKQACFIKQTNIFI